MSPPTVDCHAESRIRTTGCGLWRLLAIVLILAGLVCGASAASNTERRAYRNATTLFHDGLWSLAERELADFIRRYPGSEFRSEALLLQAQAQFKQEKFTEAIALLESGMAGAGALADEYHFWIAEAAYQNKQFAAAGDAYARLLRDFPRSNRRLQASVGEAFCRFNLKEYARVKELLADPQGDFQRQIRARPSDELAVRGYLLLGETLFITREYAAAEEALQKLANVKLEPLLDWRRQYLLCRVQIAAGKLKEALAGAERLMTLAAETRQKESLTQSVELLGGIHEQLGHLDEAVAVYEKNLADHVTPEQRRQTLLKIIQLTVGRKRTADAIAKLESFIRQYPTDPALDLAHVTLGELKLNEYVAVASAQLPTNPPVPPPPVATNSLLQAAAHFDAVITNFTSSPYLGKAYFSRGWCQWLLGNIEACQGSFRQAAERLPFGEEQAVARFKLADALYWARDFTNAAAHYRRVVEDYANLPEARERLLGQALYQILRASIEINDLQAATDAFSKIREWFPDRYYSERSMLLLGQALNRVDRPEEARKVIVEMIKRFPNSKLAGEAQLALARSFAQEKLWDDALKAYDAWAANEAWRQNPQAEFDRAWVAYQAGHETNALAIFTNFVAAFPTNELAPQAQFWVASHYFRAGDLTNAEAHFQLLFQNWPSSELTYQARLMAGRAALARQSTRDATNYFLTLINDPKCPTNIVCMACFAYADTLIELPVTESTRSVERYNDAIVTLNKIPQISPTNRLVAAAYGRMGDCYLQLAVIDPGYYTNAADAYLKAINLADDVAVRSQAEIGLGIVREKQARLKSGPQQSQLLEEALQSYLNVAHGVRLKLDKGEKADPFWVKKAFLAAASLLEQQGQWDAAIAQYKRLKAQLPALADFCDKRIKSAGEKRDGRLPVP